MSLCLSQTCTDVNSWVGAKNTGGNFITSFDAENSIEYVDGTSYKHIKNMKYMFDDADTTEHGKIFRVSLVRLSNRAKES